MASPAIQAVFHFVFFVAIQAPAHLQWRNSFDPVHGFNRTVAGLTLQPGRHVPFMRKMNKIGQVMDLDPRDGFFVLPKRHQFLDLGPVGGHFLVATSTFVNAGYAGRCGAAGLHMTVHARNFEIGGVNPVTEIDRLLRSIVREESDIDPIAEQKPGEPAAEDQTHRLEYL